MEWPLFIQAQVMMRTLCYSRDKLSQQGLYKKDRTHVACGRKEAGCAVATERRGDREVVVAVEVEAR